MDINKKVDLGKLSSEKVMKRGDKILEEDEKSLQNMIKTLSKGRSMMQDTNKELYKNNSGHPFVSEYFGQDRELPLKEMKKDLEFV